MRLGILGGTFDPIHLGHLAAGDAAGELLDLRPILAVPAHHPPHREGAPFASAYHRFAMVALAVANRPRFLASDIELVADAWSFTSDTLARLAATGVERWQMFFITGADAFAEIATWHDYPRVLDLAHFVIVSRPGLSSPSLRATLPMLAGRMIDARTAADAGVLDVARTTRILLLDATTPDVSSTGIRRQARDGGSLDGMVPPAVADYTVRHGLYAPRDSTYGDSIPGRGEVGGAR
jgi:nicotinate-nucleotide adenylyltransferase